LDKSVEEEPVEAEKPVEESVAAMSQEEKDQYYYLKELEDAKLTD